MDHYIIMVSIILLFHHDCSLVHHELFLYHHSISQETGCWYYKHEIAMVRRSDITKNPSDTQMVTDIVMVHSTTTIL